MFLAVVVLGLRGLLKGRRSWRLLIMIPAGMVLYPKQPFSHHDVTFRLRLHP